MTRRDAVLVVVVVMVGLLLGAFVVTESSQLEHARQWLRGTPPRGAVPLPQLVATKQVERDLPADVVALDRRVVQEARDAIPAEGLDGALVRIRKALATRGSDDAVLLRIEEHALRQLVEPESIERVSRRPGDAIGVGVPSAPSLFVLLEQRPGGLGDPEHPLRPLARAYMASAFVHMGATQRSSALLTRELANVVDANPDVDAAEVLVDVLAAWATLPRLVSENSAFLVEGRAPRSVCVDLCQKLLDRPLDARPLCDALAEIAADSDRPQLERALAAMALAELANIPIGLGWGLPRDDTEGAASPRFTMTREWRSLRDLDAEEGFAARVALAVRGWDALQPDPLSFDPPAALRRHFRGARQWLDGHVDPYAEGPRLRDEVRDVANGSVSPVEHLRALAEGATEPADVLRRMEQHQNLRIPLHHLLLLTGAAGRELPPRRTATPSRTGIVNAWRTTLGLDRLLVTLRVARLERRLGGLELLDESREIVRVGSRGALLWSEPVRETHANATWTPPGALGDAWPTARMTERLAVLASWDDDGAEVRIRDLRLDIVRSHGGGSSSTSGAAVPMGIPTALAPWANAHSEASRRAYLVMVTPGKLTGAAWTLDDWRGATVEALDDVREIPDHDRAQHARGALGETLALLRPRVDVARLWELESHRSGSGITRALAFAGEQVLIEEDAPHEQGIATIDGRRLSARERAELALAAPQVNVRVAMWRLLSYHYPDSERASPLLAEELLEIAETEPDRVPPSVQEVMALIRSASAGQSGNNVFRVVASIIWSVVGLLLVLCIVGRRRAHGARGTAAMLLVAALVVAQTDIFVAGWILTPAWAGWALAALAVWFVGRERVGRDMRATIALFAAAAIASAAAFLVGGSVGTAARVVAALAALAGCVALAPLAPALIRDLVPAEASRLPRRPRASPGWRLGIRVAIPAALAAGAIGGATKLQMRHVAEASLVYVAVATCFGGVLLWRLSLGRVGTRRALPVPFLVGLVVPGLVLLIAEASSSSAGGAPQDLADPLGPLLRMWIACALIFVLVRTFDAARVRGRADAAEAEAAAAAAGGDRGSRHGPPQGTAPTPPST